MLTRSIDPFFAPMPSKKQDDDGPRLRRSSSTSVPPRSPAGMMKQSAMTSPILSPPRTGPITNHGWRQLRARNQHQPAVPLRHLSLESNSGHSPRKAQSNPPSPTRLVSSTSVGSLTPTKGVSRPRGRRSNLSQHLRRRSPQVLPSLSPSCPQQTVRGVKRRVFQCLLFLFMSTCLIVHHHFHLIEVKEVMEEAHLTGKDQALHQNHLMWWKQLASTPFSWTVARRPPSSSSSTTTADQTMLHRYQNALRSTCETQLRETFGSRFVTAQKTLEVELVLFEEMQQVVHTVVVQVPHQEMPYTSWTWLNQVRNGYWKQAIVEQANPNDPFSLAVTMNENDGKKKKKKNRDQDPVVSAPLERIESMVYDTSAPFVVGLKQQQQTNNDGSTTTHTILTIHGKASTCDSDHEVCFGAVVSGTESLEAIMKFNQDNTDERQQRRITIHHAKVRTS